MDDTYRPVGFSEAVQCTRFYVPLQTKSEWTHPCLVQWRTHLKFICLELHIPRFNPSLLSEGHTRIALDKHCRRDFALAKCARSWQLLGTAQNWQPSHVSCWPRAQGHGRCGRWYGICFLSTKSHVKIFVTPYKMEYLHMKFIGWWFHVDSVYILVTQIELCVSHVTYRAGRVSRWEYVYKLL